MKVTWGALALVGSCSATQVTPVQKVIDMLQGMLEKGKKRKAC